jgi:hypothetical protein
MIAQRGPDAGPGSVQDDRQSGQQSEAGRYGHTPEVFVSRARSLESRMPEKAPRMPYDHCKGLGLGRAFAPYRRRNLSFGKGLGYALMRVLDKCSAPAMT